jgi:hypothetical protein
MLDVAFKESAVICHALARGSQSLILRDPGESTANWVVGEEPTRFWLWPTYSKYFAKKLKPEAAELEREVKTSRPSEGTARLTHFAEVAGIYHAPNALATLAIAPLHLWSDETVEAIFNANPSGIFVLPVRVYRAAAPTELSERATSGEIDCWVALAQPLETKGATPVLSDEAFRDVLRKLDAVLKPTALA